MSAEDHGREGASRRIAVRSARAFRPGLVWLGGFKSDMGGTKAVALEQWAQQHGRACVRFDYSGHGESGGAFTDGTIGRWLDESLAVFDACCRRAADPGRLVDGRLDRAALLRACELRRARGGGRTPRSPAWC